MKHIDQKVIEKILQVKELADKGYQWEADAARIMLHKLMLKHNLTLEDLNRMTDKKLWQHKEGKMYTILVIKTVAAYLGYERISSSSTHIRKTKSWWSEFYIELYDYEIIELEIMIRRYKSLFKKEKSSFEKMFGEAFYAKHQLWCSVPDSKADDIADSLSADERQKLRLIYQGLSDASYRKALNSK